MKKRFLCMIFVLCAALLLLPITATPSLPRLVDEADLLSDVEYDTLVAKLDEISTRQACDVVIFTVDSLNSKDVTAYADDAFDDNGFGQGSDYSGILFLISMAEREWAISTCGSAIAIFTDARQADMIDALLDDLSGGNYAEAFTIFADRCDSYITEGVPAYIPSYSDPDVSEFPYEYTPPVEYEADSSIPLLSVLGVSLVIGLIAAIIYTAILRGQLKSVSAATNAANYTREGSFKLTERREVFLYRNVTKRPRQQNNGSSGGHSGGRSSSSHSSTHRSSSGRSHGGSRGRF